ncbi:hypothetical protein [Vibrio parahaemolyticus]|nr:hypothetical protein [Vibrio parahaemolyticus]
MIFLLTGKQVAALESKKRDDEACDEIETVHPGYLGSIAMQEIENQMMF